MEQKRLEQYRELIQDIPMLMNYVPDNEMDLIIFDGRTGEYLISPHIHLDSDEQDVFDMTLHIFSIIIAQYGHPVHGRPVIIIPVIITDDYTEYHHISRKIIHMARTMLNSIPPINLGVPATVTGLRGAPRFRPWVGEYELSDGEYTAKNWKTTTRTVEYIRRGHIIYPDHASWAAAD